MIFRLHLIIFLATLALSLPTYAQKNKAVIIDAIKQECRSVNSDTTYKLVTLENDAFLENSPDGGGELIGYFKGKQIKKIHQWIGLSTGNEVKEFYFKNGQLIFVDVRFNSFVYDSENQQLDLTKTETTFEGHYYFHNKKLIDHSTTGHNRFEDDGIDQTNILVMEANRNLKLFAKKKQ